MDLGPCNKIHDPALKADFEIASEKRDYGYDIDVSIQCTWIMLRRGLKQKTVHFYTLGCFGVHLLYILYICFGIFLLVVCILTCAMGLSQYGTTWNIYRDNTHQNI